MWCDAGKSQQCDQVCLMAALLKTWNKCLQLLNNAWLKATFDDNGAHAITLRPNRCRKSPSTNVCVDPACIKANHFDE